MQVFSSELVYSIISKKVKFLHTTFTGISSHGNLASLPFTKVFRECSQGFLDILVCCQLALSCGCEAKRIKFVDYSLDEFMPNAMPRSMMFSVLFMDFENFLLALRGKGELIIETINFYHGLFVEKCEPKRYGGHNTR